MKRTSRFLALILSAVTAIGAIPNVTSEAIWDDRYAGVMTELYSPPEGYEKFESSELYRNYSEYFDSGAVVYRSIENRQFFAAYYYFEFSHLELDPVGDGWKEIYAKYSDKLNMDSAIELSDTTVRIMDWVNSGSEQYEDVNAEIETRYNAIAEKYDTLMKMCTEMYEAGCIEGAWYKPFSAIAMPLCTDSFYIYDYDGTAEELEAFVTQICPEATVRAYTDSYSVVFNYKGASAEDYFAVVDAVKSMDAECTVDDDIVVYEEAAYGVPSLGDDSIDVIAMLEEPDVLVGDTNNDGKVGIQDIVILGKANADIVTLNRTQATAADCNGDGELTSDDITVLLRYITELIAVLPSL